MPGKRFVKWNLEGNRQLSTETCGAVPTPECSYLKGAKDLAADPDGPCDPGVFGGIECGVVDWKSHWRRTDTLRRHTVDQGHATYERDRDFRK